MVPNKATQPKPSPYSDSLPAPVDIRRVAEFVEFTKWFAHPSYEREPQTQKEFAKLIRVDEDTLTAWKKRPEFWPLTGEFLHELMRENMPDVIGSLFDRIMSGKGGAGDVKLFLALAEGLPVNQKPKTN